MTQYFKVCVFVRARPASARRAGARFTGLVAMRLILLYTTMSTYIYIYIYMHTHTHTYTCLYMSIYIYICRCRERILGRTAHAADARQRSRRRAPGRAAQRPKLSARSFPTENIPGAGILDGTLVLGAFAPPKSKILTRGRANGTRISAGGTAADAHMI